MAGALPLKPRSDSEMPEVHYKVLNLLHDYLVSHINFDSLHDQLISAEAFDDITLSDMKEESKSSGRIRFLLAVLKKSDQDTYVIFKRGLENTKQGHIVERLVAEEKKVRQQLEAEARRMQPPTGESQKPGVQAEVSHGNPADADGDTRRPVMAQPTVDNSKEDSMISIPHKKPKE